MRCSIRLSDGGSSTSTAETYGGDVLTGHVIKARFIGERVCYHLVSSPDVNLGEQVDTNKRAQVDRRARAARASHSGGMGERRRPDGLRTVLTELPVHACIRTCEHGEALRAA